MDDSTALGWLADRPSVPTGVSWGVPWEEGELSRDKTVEVHDGSRAIVPVQTRPDGLLARRERQVNRTRRKVRW